MSTRSFSLQGITLRGLEFFLLFHLKVKSEVKKKLLEINDNNKH